MAKPNRMWLKFEFLVHLTPEQPDIDKSNLIRKIPSRVTKPFRNTVFGIADAMTHWIVWFGRGPRRSILRKGALVSLKNCLAATASTGDLSTRESIRPVSPPIEFTTPNPSSDKESDEATRLLGARLDHTNHISGASERSQSIGR